MKESNDRGMRAANDTNDAAFGAPRTGQTAETRNSCNHVIAVHGVFNVIAWNENVAIDIREGHIGHNEAVAILVKHEPAFNLLAGHRFVLRKLVVALFGCALAAFPGGRSLGSRAEEKAFVSELFDEAAFFQSIKYLL